MAIAERRAKAPQKKKEEEEVEMMMMNNTLYELNTHTFYLIPFAVIPTIAVVIK